MAGKVINSNFVLLSKFGANRQESASKTATSHIREPLGAILKNNYEKNNITSDFDNYLFKFFTKYVEKSCG